MCVLIEGGQSSYEGYFIWFVLKTLQLELKEVVPLFQ